MTIELLDTTMIADIVIEISTLIGENKTQLVKLDSIMGDGDLGITMDKGFTAASKAIRDYEDTDVGTALYYAGTAMNGAASSTMGTLIATAFMSAGKEVKGLEQVNSMAIVCMMRSALNGIMRRGGAKPGEKTLLDALVPAVNAFEEAVAQGKTLASAVELACDAAEKGVEDTKGMVAQHGRARYYADRSKGKQDPGATVIMLIFRAIRGVLAKR